MKTSLFFDGITQRPLPVGEQQAFAPLFFPRASMMGAIFTADRDAVTALLPTTRHRPLSAGRGRALVALHCFEYQSSQLGPYNEVGVSLPIHLGAGPVLTPLCLVRSLWESAFHSFVVQLPVDSELARVGGVQYFNAPKFMTDIRYGEDAKRRTCRVTEPGTGALLFELAGPRLATRHHRQDLERREQLKTLTLHTYPVIDDEIRRATGVLNLIRERSVLLPRDVTLTLGSGPRAEELRSLRLGRALHYAYAPECQLLLNLPERIA